MSTNGTTAASRFEPSRYLTKIGSADYLEVKWRLVWLRHEHPDAVIETELIEHTQQAALFRARIAIPGGGVATGYGSETPGDFRDYVEKAETKAIGRALAALGYGTQFCPDFDFGATAGRVVDSPVDIGRTRGWTNTSGDQEPSQESGAESARRRVQATEQPATERQLQFMQRVAHDAGLDDNGLRAEIRGITDGQRLELTRREASMLIDRLKAMAVDSDARPPPVSEVALDIQGVEYRDVAPSPSDDGPGASWTTFWPWARANGIVDKIAIEQAIGHAIGNMTPRAVYQAVMASQQAPEQPAAGSSETPIPDVQKRKPPDGIKMTERQWWKMWACGNEKMPRQADEGLHAFIHHTFGHDSLKDVTVEEASKLIDWLEGRDEAQVMVYVGPLLRQRAIERGQQELSIEGAPRQHAEVAP